MNPKKEKGQRCRQSMIGVTFPPDRIPEVKEAAKLHGLTVSSWARMTLYAALDDLKKEKMVG